MARNNYNYPLGAKGKVIGRPYQGTHGKAFNAKGGSNNWESENAVDIAVPKGTPVYAIANGTIGSQIGAQGGGRFAGLRLHLVTGDNEFFYGHLSKLVVKAGEQVHVGQLLGYSGEANGVAHLHLAAKVGNPLDDLGGKINTQQPPPADTGQQTGQSPVPTAPNVDPQNVTTEDDQTLANDIANIPQEPSATPPIANVPLEGDTIDTSVAPMGAGSAASYWQMIASNGQVSPATMYLAQLSQSADNGGS